MANDFGVRDKRQIVAVVESNIDDCPMRDLDSVVSTTGSAPNEHAATSRQCAGKRSVRRQVCKQIARDVGG